MARWDRISSRGNVVDRRGAAPVIGGMSLTGLALYLAFRLLTGGDISVNDLEVLSSIAPPAQNIEQFEGEDSYEVFASTVLGSNNALWEQEFSEINRTYTEPRLVLFRTGTESACGGATSQVGPHYCSLDETIYLDETFFDELIRRFGAQGGDVAEAYVIAHEVAHHVQNKLGIMGTVQEQMRRDPSSQNDFSIALELQADCLAGVWAKSIEDVGVLLPGEIEEAMNAAEAVGDDRIQESVTGRVTPENWTHGSSEQRVAWFNRGFEGGDMRVCNTFD